MRNKIIALLSLLLSIQSYSADIVTLGGLPNSELEFVSEILEGSYSFHEKTNTSLATKWFSILKKEKVDSIFSIGIDPKKMNYESIEEVLDKAEEEGRIVLAPFTPRDGFLCLQMKKRNNILFIMPSGDLGKNLNTPGIGVTWCQAPNLLFVGPLVNAGKYYAKGDYGYKYVRVAAPGFNIKVIDENDRRTIMSSSLASAAIVAGKVVKFSKKYPRVKGLYLAHKFLQSRTRSNPKLSSKVFRGNITLK
jgi:hypothetical protein